MGTADRRQALRCAVPALALVAVLGLASCSADPVRGPSGTPASPMAPDGASTVGAAATATPAAELRAGLTWQLVERAHLLAAARTALVREGDRAAPAVRSAQDRLEAGAADLTRTVGGGPAVRAALDRELEAVLAGEIDGPAVTAAHLAAATSLTAVAPVLRTLELTQALDRSTAHLSDVVPAADGAAAEVAAGLVANAVAARDGLGSTESSAVVLRADLTRLLVGRAHLAGCAPTEAPLAALTSTLTRRLAVGADGAALGAALRAGNAALQAGGTATAVGDVDRLGRARAALLAADRDLAGRLAVAVPALPAPLVQRELDLLRTPLVAAAGGRVSGSDDAAALAVVAARRAVVTAAVLAAGIADQQRLS